MDNENRFQLFSGGAEKFAENLKNVVDKARPESAFKDPVTSGDYTVITATDIDVAMWGGFGSGTKPGGSSGTEQQGGGGGGGAMTHARPVASIVAGPGGVTVHPILDFTKIILTAITVIGSMFMVMAKVSAARKFPHRLMMHRHWKGK